MSTNIQQEKVDVIFDRLVKTYGLSGGAVIHRALAKGEITQEIRRKVRRVCAPYGGPLATH